jgi:hypothetical protein
MKKISIIEGYPDYIKVRLEQRGVKRKNLLPEQINGSSLELIIEDLLLWDKEGIKVSFKGGDAVLHGKIAEVAATWSEFANIKLDFGYEPDFQTYRKWISGDLSQIRVGFADSGYWSIIGTDSQDPDIILPGEITLNLEKFDAQLPSDWKTIVLHEFGHALGFHHEYQSPVYARLSKEDKEIAGLAYPFDEARITRLKNARKQNLKIILKKDQLKESFSETPADSFEKHFPVWKSQLDSLNLIPDQELNSSVDFEDKVKRQVNISEQIKKVSLDNEVKREILIAGGQAGEDPSSLGNGMKLGNLLPSSFAYQFLADRLDALVKMHQLLANVKLSDVEDCDTVGDCILMVNGKL